MMNTTLNKEIKTLFKVEGRDVVRKDKPKEKQ